MTDRKEYDDALLRLIALADEDHGQDALEIAGWADAYVESLTVALVMTKERIRLDADTLKAQVAAYDSLVKRAKERDGSRRGECHKCGGDAAWEKGLGDDEESVGASYLMCQNEDCRKLISTRGTV